MTQRSPVHVVLTRMGLLRGRFALALLLTLVLGLGVTYWLFVALENTEERNSVSKHARQIATAVAGVATQAAGDPIRMRSICQAAQAAMVDEQLQVTFGGQSMCRTSTSPFEGEITTVQPFPGGEVMVISDLTPTNTTALELTAVAGALLVLGLAVTLLVSRRIVHEIREPIARAVEVADRVAGGDLTARMGPSAFEDLSHLGRAFDGMAGRLEEADRLQQQFLADLAHEIATPLNVVAGFATAFSDGTVDDPRERAEAAQAIAHETARVRQLLDDLRRLHRLDWAEPVRSEPVDLTALCRELAARLGRTAEAARVKVSVSGRKLVCWCDRRLAESVITNLLTNAIRYTPSGGRVTLATSRWERWAVVSVRDTGIGIAAEHRARIFDRLYRVDEARDRHTGGSGLGLAIAQRAALAMGGRIEVDSAPGRGSEFRLMLPDRTAPAQGLEAPAGTAATGTAPAGAAPAGTAATGTAAASAAAAGTSPAASTPAA